MAKYKKELNRDTTYLYSLSNAQIKKLTPYLDENKVNLTNKSRKFCFFYVMNGLYALEAARKAGYSENGIYVTANKLVRSGNNIKAIKLIMDNEIQTNKDKLEYDIFSILKTIKDYDILEYVNEDGSLKTKLSQIPKALRKIITKVETKYYGKNADQKVITLEFMGKEYALNLLIKYINMLKDNSDQTNSLTNETMSELLDMLHGKK